MKTGIKITAALAIIAVTVLAIVGAMWPKEVEEPPGDMAPAGYADFEVAVDPEFSRTVSSQLSELGDDPALGFRSAGSPAEAEAAALLAQTMRDIGLENVTIDNSESDGWTFGGADITFKTAGGVATSAALGGYQTDIAAEGESLPIVYLGQGTAADYEGVDVKGKLVLIDIDQENEWWINYPAYQARLKGARAVVACSVMEEENGGRIGSQDICGDAGAPALAISARDSEAIRDAIDSYGYEDGGVRQIDTILNADSKVVKDKGTLNIWGEIPGKSDEAIMFIAHYDGYYHSFYDDAAGVGIVLGIAKAMRESGIEPEKTFRFVFHGAEEWGRSGTEADWATGAYGQIINNRPEWAEQGFALFNVDSGYPLEQMKSFEVNVPVEMQGFVTSSISTFAERGDVSISHSVSPPSTYREDFIYNACGVPTIATEGGEGDEQYFASMYHSNMDSLDVGGYSTAGASGMSKYIGYAALILDKVPLRPLSFAGRIEQFDGTLRDGEGGAYLPYVTTHLTANVGRAAETANKLDEFITYFNSGYMMAAIDAEGNGNGEGSDAAGAGAAGSGTSAEDAAGKLKGLKKLAPAINKNIYVIYRELQDAMLKLDRNLEAGFANESLQSNLLHLGDAKAALQDGDAEAAIGSLSEIESVYCATAFDKATCDKFVKGLDDNIKGTWAEGRVVSEACYADDIVRSLMNRPEDGGSGSDDGSDEGDTGDGSDEGGGSGAGDYSAELAMLDKLIGEQTDALKAVYDNQEGALAIITDSMNELLDIYGSKEESEGVGA